MDSVRLFVGIYGYPKKTIEGIESKGQTLGEEGRARKKRMVTEG